MSIETQSRVGGAGRIAIWKPLAHSHCRSRLNINQTLSLHSIKPSSVFPSLFKWNPVSPVWPIDRLCAIRVHPVFPACCMPLSACLSGLQPHQACSCLWASALGGLSLSLESSSAECLVIQGQAHTVPLQGPSLPPYLKPPFSLSTDQLLSTPLP